jgi:hypothetical protein
LEIPILTYGSEVLKIRKADEKRLLALEMKIMKRTTGCISSEPRRNSDILKELKINYLIIKCIQNS